MYTWNKHNVGTPVMIICQVEDPITVATLCIIFVGCDFVSFTGTPLIPSVEAAMLKLRNAASVSYFLYMHVIQTKQVNIFTTIIHFHFLHS